MTRSDLYLNKVWHVLYSKYGVDTADREIDPLAWYINSARASVAFLNALVQVKPFMIARKLHMGGSYDETVQRIKDYLNI